MKTSLRSPWIFSVALLAFVVCSAHANNITVTNVSLVSVNTNAGILQIKFDLAWENSWRVTAPPANWDAAWVFAKYQGADGVWRHCSLSANTADHTVPAGATLQVGLTGARAVGAFTYRSTTGSGTVSWPNLRLQWNYASDGVRNSDLVSVDVSAIEMVYVPTGPFYAGDGASSNRFHLGNNPSAPFYLLGGGTITLNDTAGSGFLWMLGLTNSLRGSVIIAPSGYNAFYCMKYECSQGQLVAFLNKTLRAYSSPWPSARAVVTGTPPLATTPTPDRGALSTENQTLAYLDWAALLPMTDLECEKACRGPLPAFGNEYAWGTALRALQAYGLTNDGTALEMVSTNFDTHFGNTWDTRTVFGVTENLLGSIVYFSNPGCFGQIFPSILNPPYQYGPCRVGMFSRISYSGTAAARVQSGATYYGIMDMTGNLGEPVYPVVHANSIVVFNANHGDGNLSAQADADVSSWPTNSIVARGGGVDISYGLRSGSYNYNNPISGVCLRGPLPSLVAVGITKSILDRSFVQRSRNTGGTIDGIEAFGIRGVRTAP